jgi:hypothetical protein
LFCFIPPSGKAAAKSPEAFGSFLPAHRCSEVLSELIRCASGAVFAHWTSDWSRLAWQKGVLANFEQRLIASI